MSEIGDLLELLHGARSRFERLHGEFRTWRHDERAEEASDALVEESKGMIVRLPAAELEPAEDESDEPDKAESEGATGAKLVRGVQDEAFGRSAIL